MWEVRIKQMYEAVGAIPPAARFSASFSSFIMCLFAFSFSHDDVNIKGKMIAEMEGF